MGSRSTQYTQTFREAWKNEHYLKDWLEAVPTEATRARCKYCKISLAARLKDLKDHANSTRHKAAAEPFSSLSRQKTLPFTSVKACVETSIIAAGLVLFVVCHAALRSVDHITDVVKRVCKTYAPAVNLKLHRTKCARIIKYIFFNYFKKILREDIEDGPYSLLIDESTDITVSKQLGICIRYFSKAQQKIINTFLQLVHIDAADAHSIVKAVKKCLDEFNLPKEKLRGIGTDKASVMTGVSAGVHAILKKEIPGLQLIRCVCHSCHLAVSEAVKQCLPRSLEFLLSETYNWFSRSSNRQSLYAALYKTINDGAEPLKIVQAAKTRWLSVEVAVKRILHQWIELKAHFEMVRGSEKCYTAELLYNMYSDPCNEIYLLFLKPVLASVQHVNKAFQSNDSDASKLLQDLTVLITSLAKMVVITGCRENLLKVKIGDFLHPRPHLRYEAENKISEYRRTGKLSVDHEIGIRQRCIDFVVCLVTELQNRLPDSVERLSLISELSPEKALRAVKASINPLAELMLKSPEQTGVIDAQWRKLDCVQWESKSTTGLWNEVLNYRDALGRNPFQELAEFAIECLVLPWSNADIERLFSAMKIVKSPHRNRLSDVMLNSILTIRSAMKRLGTCCRTFEFPENVLREIGTLAAYRSSEPAESAGSAPDGPEDDDFDDLILALEESENKSSCD